MLLTLSRQHSLQTNVIQSTYMKVNVAKRYKITRPKGLLDPTICQNLLFINTMNLEII